MARPSRVDEVLFEIARTLDFCRNDPAFPGSHRHRAHATGHVEARLEGGGGIPAVIVPALRTLNDFLRGRLFLLKPKAELPIRFWKIADPVVLWTALQYLYGHLLAIVDDDESALPPLPAGYATVCTIFHAFEQIDNEGVETAIGNLCPDCRDPLVAQLRGIGLDALADAFARAWATHPTGANADADAFDAAADRLHEWIEADATLQAIHRYVAGHAEAFESPGRNA